MKHSYEPRQSSSPECSRLRAAKARAEPDSTLALSRLVLAGLTVLLIVLGLVGLEGSLAACALIGAAAVLTLLSASVFHDLGDPEP